MNIIRHIEHPFESRKDVLERLNAIVPAEIPGIYRVDIAVDDPRSPALEAELKGAAVSARAKPRTWLLRRYADEDLRSLAHVVLVPRKYMEAPDIQREYEAMCFETSSLENAPRVDFIEVTGRWAISELGKGVLEAAKVAGVRVLPAVLFDPAEGECEDWSQVGGRYWELVVDDVFPQVQPATAEDDAFGDRSYRFSRGACEGVKHSEMAKVPFGVIPFAQIALVISQRLYRLFEEAGLAADYRPAEMVDV